jgi:hypothetical protein
VPVGERPLGKCAGDTPKIRNPQSAIRNFPIRRGFSLLEAVAALAVTSIIVLSIGSALLLAGRAMPDVHSPTADCLAGADAVEPMLAELQYAIAINQRSARLIEFTVSDRNGDGFPEVIHYEWSGTAGDPLTRTYNGGAAVTVIANVRDFSLSYDLQTTSTQVPQGNESAETLLIGYSSAQNLADYTIQSNSLYSEYFYPVLPANAVSWKVTRVQFYAEQSGLSSSGQTWVQLQTPTTGGLPSGVVLEQKSLQESGLWFFYWQQQVSYTQVSGLAPQQGLCLVFLWASGSDGSCRVMGQNPGVTASNLALLKSTNQAVNWSVQPGQSLLFSVYGTVTTAGTPQVQTLYNLNSVSIRLRTGTDGQATVQTGVRTLNRPQVT